MPGFSLRLAQDRAYFDQDVQKLLTCLPHLQQRLQTGENDVSFLRRFLRLREVHMAMRAFRKLSGLQNRQRTPECQNVVKQAADVFCAVRHQLSNLDVRDLLVIISKPHVQALLYAHDKIARREFEPKLQPEMPSVRNSRDVDDLAMKVVQLIKLNEPLGATIQQNDTTGALEIARVLNGGAADKSGLIHVGDELYEVDDMCVRGMVPDEVARLIAERNGPVTLKLYPGCSNSFSIREGRTRVKALFSYDPYSDRSIPCAEAGLIFNTGDILHITSQEDPMWWQAKNESDRKLPVGLVPSRQLQERRFSEQRFSQKDPQTRGSVRLLTALGLPGFVAQVGRIRNTMLSAVRDEELRQLKKNGPRPMSPCTLSPKFLHGKKLKKTMYHSLQATALEGDEVPTYEEVELYLAPPGRFRPIVLVGATAVGKNELKRRLISGNSKHFEEAVPYTTRRRKRYEKEGTEYYFITRAEMEKEILAKRFLEYGEYKGNLYGTKLESIKRIMDSGKVAVITINFQALKVVRQRDLKPFIIFIEPPPFDILRETRYTRKARKTIENDLTRLLQDDDFEEMVIVSKKLRQKYEYLFDAVLVNDSLEPAVEELIEITKRIETTPSWIPSQWIQ